MAKVIDAILRLKDQMTPALRQATQSLSEHEKVNRRVSKSIQKTGKNITTLGAKFALLSAPLEGAALAGLKLHASFQDGMAKVSTAVDTTKVSIQELSDGLRKVSDETGASVVDLTNAEYQALSANVDAAHASDFMMTAVKTSTAGFSDQTTAVDGLTTMLNAYGMQTSEVGKVADQMIAAQSAGKTTFNEISQSIGGVATSASMAGIKTEELLASIDAITKKGVKTPEAVTQVQAIITALQKQSKQTAKAAQSIGMDFSEAHLKAVGFAQFLKEIKDKSGGDSTTLTHLFGRVEGTNGFKEITADMQDYNNILDKVKNSTGSMSEAYEKMLTPAQRTRIALNELKNAGMDLGAGLEPLLLRTSAAIKTFANWLRQLTPAQKELFVDVAQGIIVFTALTMVLGKIIGVYGTLFGTVAKVGAAIGKAGGVGKAITKELPLLSKAGALFKTFFSTIINGFKLMRLAFVGNPIGLALLALTVIIGLVITHWQQFKDVCAIVWQHVTTTVSSAIDRVQAKFSGLYTKFAAIGGKIADNLAWVWSKIMADGTSSSQIVSAIFNTLGAVIKAIFEGIAINIETAINVVIDILNFFMDGLGGVIQFITCVFAGDWAGAWAAIKETFTSCWSDIKAIYDDVISGISRGIDIIMGKAHEAKDTAADAGDGGEPEGHWTGSSWFSGGLTQVHGKRIIKQCI